MIKRQNSAKKKKGNKGQTTTSRDPRTPEQVKVNRGRSRKTYQTRERDTRNNSKRDRTIEITQNSLTR